MSATTFPTLTPNTDALTQWNSFSVTAPSGLVPWPAFYDGTEVVTVTGWATTWSMLLDNSFYQITPWWTPITTQFSASSKLHDDGTYIWAVVQRSWFNFSIIRINKTTYAIDTLADIAVLSYTTFLSAYRDSWVININFYDSPVTTYRYYPYDTGTNTWWSQLPWTYTTWTNMPVSMPLDGNNVEWFVMFSVVPAQDIFVSWFRYV